MAAIHRREVLRLAGAIAGAALLPLGRDAWAAAGREGENRLVVIFLRGAVDGLSVVVPYNDPHYHTARPTIALERGGAKGVIDLDGNFGLNPALAAVMPYWQNGSLAFVHAAGSPDPSRSHFDAQLIMENGTGQASSPNGWLNRLLAQLPGPTVPPRGVSFGSALPQIMRGGIEVETMDPRGNGALPSPLDDPETASAFDRLYGGADDIARAYHEAKLARREAITVMAADDAMAKEQIAADNGAPRADQAAVIANRLGHLMAREPRFRVGFMAFGGWDTHVRQGNADGQLANRLRYLGDGLAALAGGLDRAYSDTVILVMSEFGRTVRENGNGGTDHGHGNVMWVMGGPVRGGKIFGDWPGLDDQRLYQGRDLAVTTDYRSVIAAALRAQLGLSNDALATLFPGAPRENRALDRLFRA